LKANQPHITKLLERCKKSDKMAQLELYKCYSKAMYNTAYRVLRDEFDAEDMMQEAFLSAFTKLEMYKGNVAFGAWLKRIVVNKCLTQLKRNKRYEAVKLEIVSTSNERELEEELLEEELNYSEIQPKKVLEALHSLRENYCVILTLNLIEGYDYEEIAQILKITNENVRTTISRAKKKLKQKLLIISNKTSVYGR